MAYCTFEQVLERIGADQQGLLSVDLANPSVIAVGTGGSLGLITTPFVRATTVQAYVNGGAVASTLSRGTGSDSRDQISLSANPALGAVVTAVPDSKAISWVNVMGCADQAAQFINKYLRRFVLPITDAEALEDLATPAVFLTMWFLRGRRGLEPTRADEIEYKSIMQQLVYYQTNPDGLALPGVPHVDAGEETGGDPLVTWGSESRVFGEATRRRVGNGSLFA